MNWQHIILAYLAIGFVVFAVERAFGWLKSERRKQRMIRALAAQARIDEAYEKAAADSISRARAYGGTGSSEVVFYGSTSGLPIADMWTLAAEVKRPWFEMPEKRDSVRPWAVN